MTLETAVLFLPLFFSSLQDSEANWPTAGFSHKETCSLKAIAPYFLNGFLGGWQQTMFRRLKSNIMLRFGEDLLPFCAKFTQMGTILLGHCILFLVIFIFILFTQVVGFLNHHQHCERYTIKVEA